MVPLQCHFFPETTPHPGLPTQLRQSSALGANAGIGISLGDDCIVEAGCYVTAGARILLEDGRVLKAKELSGQKGLLFRRNSQSGALEATRRTANWDGLNSQLHS